MIGQQAVSGVHSTIEALYLILKIESSFWHIHEFQNKNLPKLWKRKYEKETKMQTKRKLYTQIFFLRQKVAQLWR